MKNKFSTNAPTAGPSDCYLFDFTLENWHISMTLMSVTFGHNRFPQPVLQAEFPFPDSPTRG
jgi:hypothetical protein